jgi:FAD:protein FMN transferase
MGVLVRLVLYAPEDASARAAARAAFGRIAELDDLLSDYRPMSELMRLSTAPAGTPIPISEDLARVLEQAQTLALLSDGAFDVTAGPLVQIWREARRTGRLPTPAELADARARTGWRNLHLDPIHRTVVLRRANMQLDLGGIGKGYAADQALRVLARLGVDRALVELGGEIAVGAPPPGDVGWLIRVAEAEPGRDALHLVHAAVSSSGDTEQFLEIDGVRYSHVIDPRTGLGLTHRHLVTVTAPSAALSDGLSTLVAVLGPEQGIPLVAAAYPAAQVYVRMLSRAPDPPQPGTPTH